MKHPTILLTGGGTGGHITPILAVAHEIKQLDPEVHVVYVGERGSKFSELTDNHPAIDGAYTVSAGKLRRYHGESWVRRLVDIRTNLLNIRDMFLFMWGIGQAWRLLGKVRPAVVFQKGGFVGVPVSLAAAVRHIPIVTHDSDAVPGLANRLISRWARVHATALPAEYYNYPTAKILPVGVLVEHTYKPVSQAQQMTYKKQLGLDPERPLVLVTGGSSGAVALNQAVVHIIDGLLQDNTSLSVIHQTGKGKAGIYNDYKHPRLQIVEFMKPMHVYTGAADIIVTRAGANAMAEFGVQGKACVVVPSPHLTGGHQIHNASVLEEQGAALVVQENQLLDAGQGLRPLIEALLHDNVKRTTIAKILQSNTRADAAHRLAVLLLEQTKTPISP